MQHSNLLLHIYWLFFSNHIPALQKNVVFCDLKGIRDYVIYGRALYGSGKGNPSATKSSTHILCPQQGRCWGLRRHEKEMLCSLYQKIHSAERCLLKRSLIVSETCFQTFWMNPGWSLDWKSLKACPLRAPLCTLECSLLHQGHKSCTTAMLLKFVNVPASAMFKRRPSLWQTKLYKNRKIYWLTWYVIEFYHF